LPGIRAGKNFKNNHKIITTTRKGYKLTLPLEIVEQSKVPVGKEGHRRRGEDREKASLLVAARPKEKGDWTADQYTNPGKGMGKKIEIGRLKEMIHYCGRKRRTGGGEVRKGLKNSWRLCGRGRADKKAQ